MKLERITSLNVLILFLFTIIHLPLIHAQEASPIQIGYAPNGLLDADLGTISFMKGEDIWLRSDHRSRVILMDPEGEIRESKLVEAGIPVFIHHFAELDQFGTWDLRISSPLRAHSIEVDLISSEIQVLSEGPSFSLESGDVMIRGRLELDRKGVYDGGFLFLAKPSSGPQTLVRSVPLIEIGGSLEVTISQDARNPRNIAISPLLFVPVELAEAEEVLPPPDIEAVIWAELIGEVPMVKSGSTPVITYLKRPVLETTKSPIILQTFANETFSFELPAYGEVGDGGSIPMRPMSTNLLVYVQMEDTIHLVSVPRFEIDKFLGKVIVDQLEIPPLVGSFDYAFSDSVEEIASYDLIYMPNVNGTERIWTTQLRPEVAQVTVFNELTSSDLNEYELIFKDGKDSVNVGGVTYVLLSDESVVMADFDLSVQGHILDSKLTNPDLIRLEAFKDSIVTVSLGRVSFVIVDGVGNDVDSGIITMRQELQDPVIVEWTNAFFPADVILPSGRYDAKVEAGGEVESFSFLIGSGVTNIDVTMQAITYIPIEFYLLLTSFAIIIVEIFIVLKVWKRALRKVTL
ncbi:MAG: hypothetical protein ACE5KG_00950 [Nitrososphaerales archaeon]